MKKIDIFDCLMKIGFTKHESVLYTTLCREGGLTGYEAAKISGISRSNAYLALAGLVEKGGAYRIESDSVKYTAIPVEELISNTRRHINQVLTYIQQHIPLRDADPDPYITISGKVNIINKMKNIINASIERVYISMSPYELEYVKGEITSAKNRGLKVVIITSLPFTMDGATTYYNEKRSGQVRIIADSSYVLTGEVIDERDSTCLYSKNKNLIELIKDSLNNEIKLIKIQEQDKT